MIRGKWLLYVLLSMLILCACSFFQQTSTPTASPTTTSRHPSTAVPSPSSSQPASVPTALPTATSQGCAVTIATQFYQALQEHNLSKAYTYLSSTATTQDGQKVTYDTFTNQVTTTNLINENFTFTVSGFRPNPPSVTVTVDSQQMHYHAHLQINQTDNTCSITSYDRI